MNALKKKLQKDLKWLKEIYVQGFLAIVAGAAFPHAFDSHPSESTLWFSVICFFIGIYFFSAWLFAEEEMQKQDKNNKPEE
jgi:hypothetical protein